tara:strand:- start:557 stop:934 length:378 start_codon:yes stop_codon:yes gene_type:complete
MLFKKNDKIAIVVKPKTHNGFVNDKDYFNRYGEMREGSKLLVSKNTITFWDTQAEENDKGEKWRCFNLSDIVSITNLSRTPLELNKKEKEKIEREKKKGYKCLSCDTTLQTDYRNKFDSNYCGDC